jgi:hypothetical protein
MAKHTKRRLRLKTYNIVSDAVDAGVRVAVERLWKHRDTLTRAEAGIYAEEIAYQVRAALEDVIDWGMDE